LCIDTVAGKNGKSSKRKPNHRKVRTEDTFWTVIHRVRSPLVHPFEPQPSCSEHLTYLRFNPCIKATHILASDRPRWLREGNGSGKKQSQESIEKETTQDSKHSSGMGKLLVNALGNDTTLENVGYKMVYQSRHVVIENKKRKKNNEANHAKANDDEEMPLGMDTSSQQCYDSELLHQKRKRMKKFGLKPPKISRKKCPTMPSATLRCRLGE